MTPDQVAELSRLRGLCAAATEGPWERYRSTRYIDAPSRQSICKVGYGLPETRDDSDIAFIAAARSAVPWLLDLIDKLTEEELGEPADLPAEIADALIAAGTYGSWAETVISAMVEFVARDSTRLRALADGWAAAADRIDAANPRGYTDDSQNAYARRECAADLRAALGASSSVLVTPTEKDQR